MKDVSVVLPAHGDSTFLRQAIESILLDDKVLLELLVIDDRLDSHGRATLSACEDPRLRVIPCDGQGLVAALNTGLAAASGSLIARMDADDVSLPTRLAQQHAFLFANPAFVAVGGQVRVIDAAGIEIGRREYPVTSTAVVQMLGHRNALAHPATMFRRELALMVGGYRAAFKGAEDYDLWLRLAERGSITNLAQDVLLYRVHGGQVTAAAAVTVAESTYLAQWCARQRARGNADSPLPWTPGQSNAPRSLRTRVTRARVQSAAALFARSRTAFARGDRVRALIAGAGWALLRPRYALAQVGALNSWLGVVTRSRRTSE